MVEPDGDARRGESNRGRWLLLAFVTGGVGLFLAFGPDEQAIIRQAHGWREAARADPALTLTVFVVAEVVLVALWLPVGLWMSVLAGFLFGVWVGTAAVSVGATAGATLAFLSARYLFSETLHDAAKVRPRFRRVLAHIDAGFREHGAYYVLLLRLTPVFPFWVLNLGLGLTRVRLWHYWWATQLGMIPVTLVIANAGASLAEVGSFRDVLSWRVLGVLCLLPLVPFVLHHMVWRWLKQNR